MDVSIEDLLAVIGELEVTKRKQAETIAQLMKEKEESEVKTTGQKDKVSRED